MREYIIQIPNLEKGKVYTINEYDSESALNVIKELLYRLCVTYGTVVGYIGINDHIDLVREQCSDWKAAAVLNWIKQNNPDCGTIIRRMEGLYNRRFVRAFIIDGTDKLKVSFFHIVLEVAFYIQSISCTFIAKLLAVPRKKWVSRAIYIVFCTRSPEGNLCCRRNYHSGKSNTLIISTLAF